jgi:hypothetical protein
VIREHSRSELEGLAELLFRRRAGTLVVDLLDAASRELVWRAVARDTLSDKTDKNAKKLAKATKKMFEDFPPESEAK